MARRIQSRSAFFLKTGSGTSASGSFGPWGSLSKGRGKKKTYIRLHTRPMGNPNPKHRFSSTNQPPRP